MNSPIHSVSRKQGRRARRGLDAARRNAVRDKTRRALTMQDASQTPTKGGATSSTTNVAELTKSDPSHPSQPTTTSARAQLMSPPHKKKSQPRRSGLHGSQSNAKRSHSISEGVHRPEPYLTEPPASGSSSTSTAGRSLSVVGARNSRRSAHAHAQQPQQCSANSLAPPASPSRSSSSHAAPADSIFSPAVWREEDENVPNQQRGRRVSVSGTPPKLRHALALVQAHGHGHGHGHPHHVNPGHAVQHSRSFTKEDFDGIEVFEDLAPEVLDRLQRDDFSEIEFHRQRGEIDHRVLAEMTACPTTPPASTAEASIASTAGAAGASAIAAMSGDSGNNSPVDGNGPSSAASSSSSRQPPHRRRRSRAHLGAPASGSTDGGGGGSPQKRASSRSPSPPPSPLKKHAPAAPGISSPAYPAQSKSRSRSRTNLSDSETSSTASSSSSSYQRLSKTDSQTTSRSLASDLSHAHGTREHCQKEEGERGDELSASSSASSSSIARHSTRRSLAVPDDTDSQGDTVMVSLLASGKFSDELNTASVTASASLFATDADADANVVGLETETCESIEIEVEVTTPDRTAAGAERDSQFSTPASASSVSSAASNAATDGDSPIHSVRSSTVSVRHHTSTSTRIQIMRDDTDTDIGTGSTDTDKQRADSGSASDRGSGVAPVDLNRALYPTDDFEAELEENLAALAADIQKDAADDGDAEMQMDDDECDPYTFIKQLPPLSEEYRTRPPCLPSLDHPSRKTLVLDLDETLVHCSVEPMRNAEIQFPVMFNGVEYTVYVRRRPYFEEFLAQVSRWFEVIVFTASQRIYAEKLLDIVDAKTKFISHRVFREACVSIDGNFLKDLTILGRDLQRTVIVDNSPQAFGYQLDNGIPIESWFDDDNDRELLRLLPVLKRVHTAVDVRHVLRKEFRLRELVDSL